MTSMTARISSIPEKTRGHRPDGWTHLTPGAVESCQMAVVRCVMFKPPNDPLDRLVDHCRNTTFGPWALGQGKKYISQRTTAIEQLTLEVPGVKCG